MLLSKDYSDIILWMKVLQCEAKNMIKIYIKKLTHFNKAKK